MTVTRIVPLGSPIPLIVGTFETRDATKAPGAKSDDSYKDGSLEASVTRIATLSGPIPVTAGSFERFGPGRGGTPGPGTYIGVILA